MADIAFGSVEKIVKIGLKIKEAADTVRRNEEECQEIQKVVARVSAILLQLHQTKMMKGPAVDGALLGLEETLDRALKLVVECQEGHIVGRFFTAGGMSKELRRVQDDISQKMMLALFAINVQATIILTNIQSDGAHRLPSQQQVVYNISWYYFLQRFCSNLHYVLASLFARHDSPCASFVTRWAVFVGVCPVLSTASMSKIVSYI